MAFESASITHGRQASSQENSSQHPSSIKTTTTNSNTINNDDLTCTRSPPQSPASITDISVIANGEQASRQQAVAIAMAQEKIASALILHHHQQQQQLHLNHANLRLKLGACGGVLGEPLHNTDVDVSSYNEPSIDVQDVTVMDDGDESNNSEMNDDAQGDLCTNAFGDNHLTNQQQQRDAFEEMQETALNLSLHNNLPDTSESNAGPQIDTSKLLRNTDQSITGDTLNLRQNLLQAFAQQQIQSLSHDLLRKRLSSIIDVATSQQQQQQHHHHQQQQQQHQLLLQQNNADNHRKQQQDQLTRVLEHNGFSSNRHNLFLADCFKSQQQAANVNLNASSMVPTLTHHQTSHSTSPPSSAGSFSSSASLHSSGGWSTSGGESVVSSPERLQRGGSISTSPLSCIMSLQQQHQGDNSMSTTNQIDLSTAPKQASTSNDAAKNHLAQQQHRSLFSHQHHHHNHHHHPELGPVHKADSDDLDRIRNFIDQFKARRGALGLTQKQAAQCFRAYTNDKYAFSDNFVGHFEGFQFRPVTAMTIADSLAEWLEFAENETRRGRQLSFMAGKVKETRKRKYEVIRIRDSAKKILVDAFEKNRSPSTSELEQLSKKTNIPSRNIEIFFKNRRTSRQYHQ